MQPVVKIDDAEVGGGTPGKIALRLREIYIDEARKKAMEEERSLKAMKGRASEEVKKARSRMQQHLNETKEDAMGDITGMAKGAFDSLRGKANDAFEEGQNVMEREWKDFTSGQDS